MPRPATENARTAFDVHLDDSHLIDPRRIRRGVDFDGASFVGADDESDFETLPDDAPPGWARP